ncbi:hypothetical protein ACN3XK_67790, partial [Actinomadura welshii]
DDRPVAARIPSLEGLTQTKAHDILERGGLELKYMAGSGKWVRYDAPDGSSVHIEMVNGRVVRTSVIDMGPNTKNRTQRWTPDGERTDSHDTGERIEC